MPEEAPKPILLRDKYRISRVVEIAEEPCSVPSLLSAVDRLFGSPNYRPPMLPAVAVRVLHIAKTPEVTFKKVVEVVESDPLFAASVLKLASSPIYSRGAPITSIQQALLHLGLHALSDLCVEAALNARLFRVPGFEVPLEAVRKHSVAVAHCARLLARKACKPAESAFSLGLLHEAGLAVGIVTLNTHSLWPRRFEPAQVWPVLLASRWEVTRRLVNVWHLPKDMGDELVALHRRNIAFNEVRAALVVADSMATHLGFGVGPEGEYVEDEAVGAAREMLGLEEAELQEVAEAATELLDSIF